MSTRLTRLGGLAAMLAPVLTIVGRTGDETIEKGFMHGAAVFVLVSGLLVFAVALWAFAHSPWRSRGCRAHRVLALRRGAVHLDPVHVGRGASFSSSSR